MKTDSGRLLPETRSNVAWNAQAEATFGWSRDETLGRNLAETIIAQT